MYLDEICDSFARIDILCPTENYDDIHESLNQTKLIIAEQNRNLEIEFPSLISHLNKCNYRYLGYARRNIFSMNEHLDYLDRMMNIFCQKLGNCLQGQNEHFSLLYMAYHIDSMIVSHLP